MFIIVVNTVFASDSTLNYPELRSATFANMWIDKIIGGSGHVGVNVVMNGYNPCQNNSDPFYGSCQMANEIPSSYYKIYHFTPTSNDFPYGIFVDNSNTNFCKNQSWCTDKISSVFNHKWANKITYSDVEIYPHDENGNYNTFTSSYGGARVIFDTFGYSANGGLYSLHVGDIHLPSYSDPTLSILNGFAYNGNVAVGADKVGIDMFQEFPGYENKKLGAIISGFSSGNTNSDGYYKSGPLYNGYYKIYLTDRTTNKKVIINANINRPFERLDIHLDQNCFGFATCQNG